MKKEIKKGTLFRAKEDTLVHYGAKLIIFLSYVNSPGIITFYVESQEIHLCNEPDFLLDFKEVKK